jgi:hypothetical protein
LGVGGGGGGAVGGGSCVGAGLCVLSVPAGNTVPPFAVTVLVSVSGSTSTSSIVANELIIYFIKKYKPVTIAQTTKNMSTLRRVNLLLIDFVDFFSNVSSISVDVVDRFIVLSVALLMLWLNLLIFECSVYLLLAKKKN